MVPFVSPGLVLILGVLRFALAGLGVYAAVRWRLGARVSRATGTFCWVMLLVNVGVATFLAVVLWGVVGARFVVDLWPQEIAALFLVYAIARGNDPLE